MLLCLSNDLIYNKSFISCIHKFAVVPGKTVKARTKTYMASFHNLKQMHIKRRYYKTFKKTKLSHRLIYYRQVLICHPNINN